MAREERILVVERKVLDEVGTFQGVTFDVDRYLGALFAPGRSRFMARPAAEKDPAYKQLIPYVIMTHGGRYLSYVRGKKAGESRLKGLRSIGIGGHINPIDDPDAHSPLFRRDFRETYETAVRREVDEEVSVETGYRDRIVALLNDDSNEVGQVHLGVVHLWVLDAPSVVRKEQMITQMGFMTPEALRAERDSMETWSSLCLDHLAEMTLAAEKGG